MALWLLPFAGFVRVLHFFCSPSAGGAKEVSPACEGWVPIAVSREPRRGDRATLQFPKQLKLLGRIPKAIFAT